VREVIAARLWLDVFGQLSRKRYKRMACHLAAFNLAEAAVFYGFEDLRLRAEDSVFRLGDQTIDNI
jgi:hypothetical protein